MAKILVVLLVLVLCVGGAGYWNYQRNAPLDAELQNRPYAAYSDDELSLLREAYESEKSSHERRLERVAQSGGAEQAYAPSDLSGKIDGFRAAQKQSARWKRARDEVLDREVEIERLQHELSIRARGLDDEWTRIMRRVTTL